MATAKDVADDVRAAFADEAAELLRRAESTVNALPGAADLEREGLLLELLRALHTLKGAAAAAGEESTKLAVHALEERARKLQSGQEILAPEVFADLLEDLATLEQLVGPSAPVTPAAQPAAARSGSSELLRVKPERVEALHTQIGELVVTRLQQEAFSVRVLELRDRITEAAGIWRSVGPELARACARNGITSTRLSEFSSLLGSAFQDAGALARDVPKVQAQSATVIGELESAVRELLLMPLGPFFDDYAKVVREASRECGKAARLSIRAEGAEIDRSVLLRLRDPLLHLVRNAVVHGLETPGERRALGKPEVGTVLLEAYCEGRRAIIRVVDDGRGIQTAAVRQKAIELGLADEQVTFDDDLLLDTLCRSGFSTRDTADSLAGRGVGLDVVATCIQELEGRLSLSNAPRAGCIFTIEVPIAASTNLGLIVRVGDRFFGLLLGHIDRVLRVAREDVVSLEGRDVVIVDGDPLAAVGLAPLVGLEQSANEAAKRPGLVLRAGKQRMVLLVEDIPGEQALVIKPLGRAFAAIRTVLGGAIQADGSIVPVLNVPSLFEFASGAQTRGDAARHPQSPARQAVASVLVADDSLTMRMLLRNILQAAGYGVTLAHDGKAALDEVERSGRFDLVISDLRMPRMDGVELCRAVRRSKHPHVPFIVVTSIGDADEKRTALEAGADGYIIKAEFEQGYFLDLVAKLSGQGTAAA